MHVLSCNFEGHFPSAVPANIYIELFVCVHVCGVEGDR